MKEVLRFDDTGKKELTKEEKCKLILLYAYANDVKRFCPNETTKGIVDNLKWWITNELSFNEFCGHLKSHGYIVKNLTTLEIGKESYESNTNIRSCGHK
jgi:hypothetical protein